MTSTEAAAVHSEHSTRVCVVGFGHWGKNLARNFHSLGCLHGVCEAGDDARAAAAQAYSGAAIFADLAEALGDNRIDAVVLATPAEAHHAMALQALDAGKDVFVEKPLALSWEDGLEMVEAARSRAKLLMVGHLMRYHPAIVKLGELVRQGALGKLEYIYSNRLSMGKIRREENALWSFAPHDISVILSLLGGELPIQAVATGGAYLQPNIADATVSQLLFDHGVRAHIFVSWLHPYKEQRLVVIGSRQMAVFEDSRPEHKLMLYDKSIHWRNGNLEAGKPQGTPVDFPAEEPLRAECRHFVECVESRQPPLTPGQEGVEVLKVLQACQHSLQMNGQPVYVRGLTGQKIRAL